MGDFFTGTAPRRTNVENVMGQVFVTMDLINQNVKHAMDLQYATIIISKEIVCNVYINQKISL